MQRDDSCSGHTGKDGMRCHHTTQNGAQFKTYELLISGIFHLIFPDHSRARVTETRESETGDKGGLLQLHLHPLLWFYVRIDEGARRPNPGCKMLWDIRKVGCKVTWLKYRIFVLFP